MNVIVLSVDDRRDIATLLDEYQPFLRSEVEQSAMLRMKLADAIIVPTARLSPTFVAIGSTVHVVELRSRDTQTVTIVHPHDASVSSRSVSILSPLGAAILGCEQGSIVEVAIPTGTLKFAIREVHARQQTLAAHPLISSLRQP